MPDDPKPLTCAGCANLGQHERPDEPMCEVSKWNDDAPIDRLLEGPVSAPWRPSWCPGFEPATPLLFRLYRGGYEESMKTVREVRDVYDINAIIAPDRVQSVRRYGGRRDPRNNWDTHIVLGGGERPVGMTNGPVLMPESMTVTFTEGTFTEPPEPREPPEGYERFSGADPKALLAWLRSVGVSDDEIEAAIDEQRDKLLARVDAELRDAMSDPRPLPELPEGTEPLTPEEERDWRAATLSKTDPEARLLATLDRDRPSAAEQANMARLWDAVQACNGPAGPLTGVAAVLLLEQRDRAREAAARLDALAGEILGPDQSIRVFWQAFPEIVRIVGHAAGAVDAYRCEAIGATADLKARVQAWLDENMGAGDAVRMEVVEADRDTLAAVIYEQRAAIKRIAAALREVARGLRGE